MTRFIDKNIYLRDNLVNTRNSKYNQSGILNHGKRINKQYCDNWFSICKKHKIKNNKVSS